MIPVPMVSLSDWPAECQVCNKINWLDWCVPFFEEPRPDLAIGQRVPGGGPDDIIGGMTCCKACHDRIHGTDRQEGNE